MKLVLQVQLQQDDSTVVLTATQTKPTFTGADFDLVSGFIRGTSIINVIKLMCWRADGLLTFTGTPTLTINQL